MRRAAQLSRLYPHLRFEGVRGNVQTRLSKLDAPDSKFAGIVLAAAGLKRVELGHRISGYLESRNVEGKPGTGHEMHGHLEVGVNGQALHPSHAVLHQDKEAAAVVGRSETAAGDERGKGAGSSEDTNTAHDANLNANSIETQQTRLGDRKWGMLHAVGQGALGIESRLGDTRVAELLAPLICRRTTLACLAERSLMRTLEGGCSVPIGVETEWGDAAGDGDNGGGTGSTKITDIASQSKTESPDLTMRAIVVSLDGTDAAEAEVTRRITTEHAAEEFGIEVAALLTKRGADKILASINLNKTVIAGQDGA